MSSKPRIVQHPDPVLLSPTRKVSLPPAHVAQLVANMFAAMYENKGIGLAANQVGESLRLAVLHVPGWPEMVLVNPEIVRSKGTDSATEGCLSVLGKKVRVERASKVWVEYSDENGNPKKLAAKGLLARAIQHEIDHLDGLTCLERSKQ